MIVDVYLFGYGTLTTHSPLYIKMKSTIFTNTLTDRTRTYSLPWIIERLDGKVADVIRSNMWKNMMHIMESHWTFYIRCVARLIFPRVFHYLCLQLYRLPMFWFKRMKRTCSWRRQLEGTKPVEAKDRVNDYETYDSEEWLQNYSTYSAIMRMHTIPSLKDLSVVGMNRNKKEPS